MRCHEARNRLTILKSSDRTSQPDNELLEHLSDCEKCTALAQADKELNWAFKAALNFGEDHPTPLLFLKSRIEQQMSEKKVTKENSIMSRYIRKRSGLSLGIAVAILLLAATTLIPFKFDKTVGYEVAVAGVNKELALDHERISLLIAALGIEGATIDVLGCEIKCNMKISELKSQKEADILVAAFEQLEGNRLITDIQSIHDHATGTWVEKAKNEFNVQFGESVDADEVHKILIEKLDLLHGDHGDNFSVFVYEDSTGENHWVADDNTSLVELKEEDADGNLVLRKYLVSEDGDTTQLIHDSELGWISKEHLSYLKQMAQQTHENGEPQNLRFGDIDTDHDNPAEKSTTGELPETFSLSQNYPNPFNPTTQIEFTLPASDYVTLEIINIKGQLVKRLIDKTMGPGTHTVKWNGTSQSGAKVASGVYLYRLHAGKNSDTKKMTLTK